MGNRTNRRIFVIVMPIFVIIFFGLLFNSILSANCSSQKECFSLVGVAIFSGLIAIWLMESHIAKKKDQGKWYFNEQNIRSDGPVLTNSQVWFRSISRVIIVAVLVTLPWIVTGGFVSMVVGASIGVNVDMLIRGIMNWIPSSKEER